MSEITDKDKWITLLLLLSSCFFQLVDLKAELYRKQEQFKHDKLGQENAGAGLTSKPKLKVKYHF